MGIQKLNSFILFCRSASGVQKYYTDQVPTAFVDRSIYFTAPLSTSLDGGLGSAQRLVLTSATFYAPKRTTALADAEKVLLALEQGRNTIPLVQQDGMFDGRFPLREVSIRAIPNPVDSVGAVSLTVSWIERTEHIIERGDLLREVALSVNEGGN